MIFVKSASQFVLLDEPFTHLNPLQAEKVKEMLIAEKPCEGILLTDHIFKHVTAICDDLYVLTNGKTHLLKSMEEIKTLCYAKL